MIEARELTRRYGDFTAVDRVSLTVDEGEIVGLLGPNGAGKTTAIRMVTGFLPPTEGSVRIGDRELFGDSVDVRREIGYLPEHVALYEEMRVSEYLAYRARLEGVPRSEAKDAIAGCLKACLLESVERKIIGTLSKGYRQRVGLAAAILHEPKVLVLDEPTVGLDPAQIIAIRELIRDLGRERTLLLSTHILPEVELLCDRVVIIDGGRVVAEGTPQGLREQWTGDDAVRIGLLPGAEAVASGLTELGGVTSVDEVSAEEFVVHCERGSDPRPEIFRLAVDRGWTLVELGIERASLEDVFVRLTTQDAVRDGTEAGSEVAQ